MVDDTPFLDSLVAANRVLIDLDATDEHRALSLSAITTLREGQRVLAELLEQQPDDLTPHQAILLQKIIDRLQAKLKFFERIV
jgi:hypothetical protein